MTYRRIINKIVNITASEVTFGHDDPRKKTLLRRYSDNCRNSCGLIFIWRLEDDGLYVFLPYAEAYALRYDLEKEL